MMAYFSKGRPPTCELQTINRSKNGGLAGILVLEKFYFLRRLLAHLHAPRMKLSIGTSSSYSLYSFLPLQYVKFIFSLNLEVDPVKNRALPIIERIVNGTNPLMIIVSRGVSKA